MNKPSKATKNPLKQEVEGLEILALVIAGFYVHSINTVLHHYMYWHTVEKPTIIFLVAPLVLVIYTTQKNNKLSRLGTAVIAVILAASFIWLSGFRVNVTPL